MKIKELLKIHAHRPYELPEHSWSFYQEWNDVFFMHWKVPFELLSEFLPAELEADSFEGDYYVSLVAFRMEKIRPRYLPSVGFLSDFYEVNLRTYVTKDGKPGVYFLSIEAEKALSAFVSRSISGLPYRKASIRRTEQGYFAENPKENRSFNATFKTSGVVPGIKSSLDRWLTERYCLYMLRNGMVRRFEIHHQEWELSGVELQQLESTYVLGNHPLIMENMSGFHYSPGVVVAAWNYEELL